MSKYLAIIPLLFAAQVSVAGVDYGSVVPSEIRSIYDGDTFKVTIADWPRIIGDKVSIRVNGVDTPEMRGKCDREIKLARQAKQHTAVFLRSGKVELRNIKRGKYFRIVADVYVDNKSLSDSLLKSGLAYDYNGGKKRSWCSPA